MTPGGAVGPDRHGRWEPGAGRRVSDCLQRPARDGRRRRAPLQGQRRSCRTKGAPSGPGDLSDLRRAPARCCRDPCLPRVWRRRAACRSSFKGHRLVGPACGQRCRVRAATCPWASLHGPRFDPAQAKASRREASSRPRGTPPCTRGYPHDGACSVGGAPSPHPRRPPAASRFRHFGSRGRPAVGPPGPPSQGTAF